MHPPNSVSAQIRNALRLVFILFALPLTMALLLNVESWGQAKKTAPPQKTVAPVKAPNWCAHAAPVSGGVATVTITVAGGNLKVDYDRVCISATEEIAWMWKGPSATNWSVEFSTGANPFHPRNNFNHGNPHSGRPAVPGNSHLIYKYTIHAAGYDDLDPDVIIRGS